MNDTKNNEQNHGQVSDCDSTDLLAIYNMCINNLKSHIEKHPGHDEDNLTAFEMSSVVAICFCKDKEEVISDLIF